MFLYLSRELLIRYCIMFLLPLQGIVCRVVAACFVYHAVLHIRYIFQLVHGQISSHRLMQKGFNASLGLLDHTFVWRYDIL